ncbi:MAG: glycosyltransferase family 4 protein [Planctomycetaceae bacterium]|nr:glycosyltransferase family 4 protein [Planctomycetaceae bacterium]
MMRIAMLTATSLPEVGGAQICVDQLARQFQISGHEVVVIGPHAHGPGTALQGNYPVVRYHRPLSQRGNYSRLKSLLMELHRERPIDLLNVHLTYPGGYVGRWFSCQTGVPMVVTPHGGDVFYRSRFRKRPLLWGRIQGALSAADAVIALSSYFGRLLAEIAPAQRHVIRIPNGVNVREFQETAVLPAEISKKCGPRYVLAVGRLVGRKGFDTAVAAMDRLVERHRDVRLVFAGDGPQRQALETMAGASRAAKQIVFLGTVTGAAKVALYQSSLMTIVPSVDEDNMPLVVLEAMACGRPVVGSRLGGIPDFVIPGQTGELAEPGDAQSLANAIGSVLDHPAREELSRNCRELALAHDWSRIADRYVELFKSVAKRDSLLRAA